MKQAKYKKQLKFTVLERTPNYRSRVQECEDMNKIAIDLRNERMRAEEEGIINPVQDAAEAERIRKEKEEKATEDERLKQKEEREAARKAEKKKEKEEEKNAKKAEKKEEKREKKKLE